MKVKYLLKGIVKSLPGIEYVYSFNKHTGGSSNARYCYSVWMRHLIYAFQNGVRNIPKIVVELGPGDSLGTGFAALLSGAEKYYALDVKKYGNVKENLKIFEELVVLFRKRADVPGVADFPKIRPLLANYSFPTHLFGHLDEMLSETRLESIREAILSLDSPDLLKNDSIIQYLVPWQQSQAIQKGTVDFVMSQSVLQSVDDLEDTYNIWQWLKPGGLQSHNIGFKSTGAEDCWYRHWTFSDLEWKIVRGRKQFFLNREPYSTHFDLLKKTASKILIEKKDIHPTVADRKKLARRFQSLSSEDLATCSAFIQAKKMSVEITP